MLTATMLTSTVVCVNIGLLYAVPSSTLLHFALQLHPIHTSAVELTH